MQPADTWGAIARNADRAGDQTYAMLARNISYSLHAAGIRLRDASDCYNTQLIAAVHEKRKPGSRFSNPPIKDLHLSFHSVLSELSSARDYLAASLAQKLGAPPRIDALNRFADWIKPEAKSQMREMPVVKEMLKAYDSTDVDPWLHDLTEYRNRFLHREPFGSAKGAYRFQYSESDLNGFRYPAIAMPLGEADLSASDIDALSRFVGLYRQMISLARLAAIHAPYEPKLLNFVSG